MWLLLQVYVLTGHSLTQRTPSTMPRKQWTPPRSGWMFHRYHCSITPILTVTVKPGTHYPFKRVLIKHPFERAVRTGRPDGWGVPSTVQTARSAVEYFSFLKFTYLSFACVLHHKVRHFMDVNHRYIYMYRAYR